MLKTWFAVMLLGLVSSLTALSQSFIIHFETFGEGTDPLEAVATVIDDKGTLASIALLGADPSKATMKNAKGENVVLKLLIHDATSRLTLLELPEALRAEKPTVNVIGNSRSLNPGDSVTTGLAQKNKVSKVVGHVKRHNGKVLPLTFVKINHPDGAQKVGVPVFNIEDELIAFVFQKDESDKGMFALPIEVLAHIQNSLAKGDKFYKPCWIGVSMDQRSDAPVIVGVRPETPARIAGLKKDDVVLSIAGKKVNDYTAVVNAFYYLEAGKSVEFVILRGTEILRMNVTPEVNPLFK